jgi:hypothetical protein
MSNGTSQNHRIPLDKAKKMTRFYRDHRGQNNIPGQLGNIVPICETFDRAGFDALLAQPGCVGVRIYYGMDDVLGLHAIIVGVDAQNRDILPAATTSTTSSSSTLSTTTTTDGVTTEETGIILDEGIRCPPTCPPPSDMNT